MAFRGYTANEDDAIKVYCRVRPFNDREQGSSVCTSVSQVEKAVIMHSKPEKCFTFDQVGGTDVTQEGVFSAVGKPICESCVDGYNGTVFAYGQTGAGKTYTMQGPISEGECVREQRGLTQRMFEYIFQLIAREAKKSGGNKEFICHASYVEIYNENIYDLLDAGATRGLNLREDIKKGVFVDGLIECPVSTHEQCSEVLENGARNRHVGSTAMNRESSRSHSVFSLVIQSKEIINGLASTKVSRLNLVDLAGSERQKLTDAAGIRLKEAGLINKSLSALGNVIMALVDRSNGKTRHIAYRDSKLTFLLKDSLGGNTKTWIIANCSPSEFSFGETLSTLKFAQRAKMIINTAKCNQDTEGNVLQLQDEIRRLKDELMSANSDRAAGVRVDTDGVSSANVHDLQHLVVQANDEKAGAIAESTRLAARMLALQEEIAAKESTVEALKLANKLKGERVSRLLSGQETLEAMEEAHNAEKEQLEKVIQINPSLKTALVENIDLRDLLATFNQKYGKTMDEADDEFLKLSVFSANMEKQFKRIVAEQDILRKKALISQRTRMAASPAPRQSPAGKNKVQAWKAEQSVKNERIRMQTMMDKAVTKRDAEIQSLQSKQVETTSELEAAQRMVKELEQAMKLEKLRHTDALSTRDALLSKQGEGDAVLSEQVAALTKEKGVLQEKLEESEQTTRMLHSKMQKDSVKSRRTSELFLQKKEEEGRTVSAQKELIAELQAAALVASAKQDELTGQLAEAMDALTDAKEELQAATLREQESRATHDRLLSSAEGLEHDAGVLRETVHDLESQLSGAAEQNETLQDENVFLNDSVANLSKLQDKLMAQLKAFESDMQEKKETIEMLQKQLASGEGDVSTLANENKDLRAEVEASKVALVEAKEEVAVTTADLASKVKELELAETEKERQRHTLTDMQKCVDDLREKNSSMSSKLESIESDLADTKSQFEAAQEQHDERASEVARLQEDIVALNAERTELEDTHGKETSELMAQVETGVVDVREAKEGLAQTEELLEALRAETKELQAQHEAALASLEESLVETKEKAVAKVTKELSMKLEAQERRYLLLNTDHDDLERRYQNVMDSLAAAEKSATEAAKAGGDVEEEVVALRAEVAKMTGELAGKTDELEALNKQHTTSKSTVDKQALEIVALQEHERSLMELTEEWEDTRRRKNEENKTLSDQLAATRKEVETLRETSARLEEETDKVTQESAEVEQMQKEELERMAASMEEKAETIARLEAEAEARTAELSKGLTRQNKLQTTLTATMDVMEEIQNKLTAIKASEEDAFQESVKAMAELERVKEEKLLYEETTKRQLRELKEQCSKLSASQHLRVKEENTALSEQNQALYNEVQQQKKRNLSLSTLLEAAGLDKENISMDSTISDVQMQEEIRKNKEKSKEHDAALSQMTDNILSRSNDRSDVTA